MDPDATLAELLDAMAVHDWDRVSEVAQNLLRWLNRGGFPPATLGPKSLGDQWHRLVAILVCSAADSKAIIACESLKRHA